MYAQHGRHSLAPKTIERFKERIRRITSRSRALAMEERIRQLNRYLMGWIGYYSFLIFQFSSLPSYLSMHSAVQSMQQYGLILFGI
jgi:hypothetical protein